MKEKIKAYLNDLLSAWRGRWAMRRWRERLDMLLIPVATFVSLLVALWLALWFFLGPPSVQIEDITVDLDRSLSVAGPDKDVNGIRDDIDNYIKVLAEKKAYNKPQVKALEQDARATQGLVTVDLDDVKAVGVADDEIERSIDCLYSRFNEDDAYKLGTQFERLVANTRQRSVAYMKFNHAMDGTVTAALPMGSGCDK